MRDEGDDCEGSIAPGQVDRHRGAGWVGDRLVGAAIGRAGAGDGAAKIVSERGAPPEISRTRTLSTPGGVRPKVTGRLHEHRCRAQRPGPQQIASDRKNNNMLSYQLYLCLRQNAVLQRAHTRSARGAVSGATFSPSSSGRGPQRPQNPRRRGQKRRRHSEHRARPRPKAGWARGGLGPGSRLWVGRFWPRREGNAGRSRRGGGVSGGGLYVCWCGCVVPSPPFG